MIKPGPVIASDVPPRAKPSNYPEPFASRVAGRQKQALGDVFGLRNFGVNRTTLKPGAMSALRHWHSVQDEFIYILSGHPTLVTNAGETALHPGMCMGFTGGDPDGHHLVNLSTEDVVYLEVGDRLPGDSGSYPDDDLKAVMGADGKWQFQHKDGALY
ncbi:cupin domain-containing protein [Sorangium sp. So ce887]|uniref:cupin domain-containing protein n=1 Tax=Sorangium sp. So ce887 TaxID=3133324 RepID=UPI003F6099FF